MPGPLTAETVPVLAMPPVKVETSCTEIPRNCAEIVPLFVIPPPPLLPNRTTLETEMPVRPAEIVPALEMPPVKVETLNTLIPVPAAEIVPELAMPPEKFETL